MRSGSLVYSATAMPFSRELLRILDRSQSYRSYTSYTAVYHIDRIDPVFSVVLCFARALRDRSHPVIVYARAVPYVSQPASMILIRGQMVWNRSISVPKYLDELMICPRCELVEETSRLNPRELVVLDRVGAHVQRRNKLCSRCYYSASMQHTAVQAVHVSFRHFALDLGGNVVVS